MAEDLGTWPPEQATVLFEALANAGLNPHGRRTRHGVVVTVPDDEADQAHQTLVQNMDAIARAARAAQPAPAKKLTRRDDDVPTGRLTTERLGALARPLGILIVGMMIAAIVPPLRLPVIIFTVAGIIYVIGRQPRDDEQP